MSSAEIRKKFLQYFKDRGHAVVPSSSLIPDDPSVLLTTAGMQQFKRYYTGELDATKDFKSKSTASIQKSFRTSDIDEVGDESHLTFFEMLGNFSFGGYFKDKAIEYGYEFITSKDWMGLEIDKVTVFDSAKVPAGDWRKSVPRDDESYKLWSKFLPKEKIHWEGIDNFWGPTGSEGPCGPTTEIYVKNKSGQSIEIWNIVFNEFYAKARTDADGTRTDAEKSGFVLTKLDKPGVDTGMGLERLAMVSQNVPTIFETDLFKPLVSAIPAGEERIKRIISDHIRGAVHLIADGIEPSNKDRGYILRRLLRRAAFHAIDLAEQEAIIPLEPTRTRKSWNERSSLKEIVDLVISLSYFDIGEKRKLIFEAIDKEVDFFKLLKSRKELRDFASRCATSKSKLVSGEEVFRLFSTLGIPIDYIKDEVAKYGLDVDTAAFDAEFKKHQEISRAGQEKKFGGHGLILNTGELKAGNEEELNKVLRLHTATHLLQRALREVLGNEVHQMGSDITPERTRFDFSFPRKMTDEEKKKVEDLVNHKIKEDLPVQFVELPKSEAEKVGALYFFKEKYPEKVKVYFVGKDIKSAWSKEFCGGPHVTHTGIIGRFRIAKDEAVGAGTRRVRGVLDK
ncbi:MAG: alanine--tRNA ligase-related protein [Patescibacteria group bacterium]